METVALLDRRVGLDAVRSFRTDLQPLLDTVWVAEDLHERGLVPLFERAPSNLSLVDAVSFEVMRRSGIDDALHSIATLPLKGSTC